MLRIREQWAGLERREPGHSERADGVDSSVRSVAVGGRQLAHVGSNNCTGEVVLPDGGARLFRIVAVAEQLVGDH